MDKQIMVNSWRIPLRNEMERTPSNVDEFQKPAELQKPDTRYYILYDFISVKYLWGERPQV